MLREPVRHEYAADQLHTGSTSLPYMRSPLRFLQVERRGEDTELAADELAAVTLAGDVCGFVWVSARLLHEKSAPGAPNKRCEQQTRASPCCQFGKSPCGCLPRGSEALVSLSPRCAPRKCVWEEWLVSFSAINLREQPSWMPKHVQRGRQVCLCGHFTTGGDVGLQP